MIFPELSDWWAVDGINHPQIFVLLYDDDEVALPNLDLPDWRYSEEKDQVVLMTDLHELLSDETLSKQRVADWAKKRAAELSSALRKANPRD